MLDRATTAAIIAAHGLTGQRAQLVRLVARMHGADAASVDAQAAALASGAIPWQTVARQIELHEAAWARAKQGAKAKGGR